MPLRRVSLAALCASLLAAPAAGAGQLVRHAPDLQALRGEPVAVVLFNPLCNACQVEAPDVARYAVTHPGVHVIAVADPLASARSVAAFARTYYASAPVTVYAGRTGATVDRLSRGVYPARAFLDARGRRVASLPGFPGASRTPAGHRV
jgi:hypothetical protein